MSIRGGVHGLPNRGLHRRNGEQCGKLQRKWNVRGGNDDELYERCVQCGGDQLSRLRWADGLRGFVLRGGSRVLLQWRYVRVLGAQHDDQLWCVRQRVRNG
jgi:hypothetical protein